MGQQAPTSLSQTSSATKFKEYSALAIRNHRNSIGNPTPIKINKEAEPQSPILISNQSEIFRQGSQLNNADKSSKLNTEKQSTPLNSNITNSNLSRVFEKGSQLVTPKKTSLKSSLNKNSRYALIKLNTDIEEKPLEE